MIIYIKGENFRPTNYESEIDSAILDFLKNLKSDKKKKKAKFFLESKILKKKFLEFPETISEISDKLYKEFNNSNFSYENFLLEEFSFEKMIKFIDKIFKKKLKRVTFEFFSGNVKDEEKSFLLLDEFNLGEKYEIGTFEDLLENY